jgi:uncharacterized protein
VQREQAFGVLEENAEQLRHTFGIGTLALFGSVARVEAGPASDVDVLVEFIEDPTFDGYMDLKLHLEELFGRRVDLVTRRGLRERARPFVEQDLIHVA